MGYLHLTIEELHSLLVEKKVTPLELAKEAIAKAKASNDNAFEYIMEKEALEIAEKLTEPEEDNPLWGIPFAVKDNFSTKDVPTTGSSNILKGYVPVFNAEVYDRLLNAKAVPIGKTTLDELAMGGSGTTGHLGNTYNPWDKKHEHQIGGSSCGSAAACAAGIVPFALGSDTGDSVRKPASHGGLVGFKPTWGRISRYGLFPFAPSLDHVAYFTRSVADSAILLNVLAGRDAKDASSSFVETEDYTKDIKRSICGKRIAVIKEILDNIRDKDVLDAFHESVGYLKEEGAIVEFVHMDEDLLKAIYPTYFVISCAEATSNNANLDGIKFGPRYPGETYQDVMINARTKGFSELIKRRFVIGSFSLLRDNQDVLFRRAQKCRRLIVEATNKILETHDAIYLPAAPSTAPRFDSNSEKLSGEYLIGDNHLAIGNFGGYPSITLPIGMKEGLPFGGNLTGRIFKERDLFNIAYGLEKHTGLKNISVKEDK